MKIRQYEDKDFENCRDICYVTSTGFDSPRMKRVLWFLYCDYYLQYEKDTCFVVANDDDEAIGYILCADNFEEYVRQYKKDYLQNVLKCSPLHWIYKIADNLMRRRIAQKYPAHLHIDIKPEGQRQGYGRQLMDALVSRLAEKNVKGVFLGVGNANKNGIAFYERYGFRLDKRYLGYSIYVLDIDTEKNKSEDK